MIFSFLQALSRWIRPNGQAGSDDSEAVLLKALDDVFPHFQDQPALYFYSIKEQVKRLVAQGKKKGILRQSLKGTTPEGRILHMIAGLCFDQLGTGCFHIHRGVLSDEGKSVRTIYLKAIDGLEKMRFFPAGEAAESRRAVDEVIAEWG